MVKGRWILHAVVICIAHGVFIPEYSPYEYEFDTNKASLHPESETHVSCSKNNPIFDNQEYPQ